MTPDKIEVIAPNLKRRLSGVTATIARLLPVQARSIGIVATGPGTAVPRPLHPATVRDPDVRPGVSGLARAAQHRDASRSHPAARS